MRYAVIFLLSSDFAGFWMVASKENRDLARQRHFCRIFPATKTEGYVLCKLPHVPSTMRNERNSSSNNNNNNNNNNKHTIPLPSPLP